MDSASGVQEFLESPCLRLSLGRIILQLQRPLAAHCNLNLLISRYAVQENGGAMSRRTRLQRCTMPPGDLPDKREAMIKKYFESRVETRLCDMQSQHRVVCLTPIHPATKPCFSCSPTAPLHTTQHN